MSMIRARTVRGLASLVAGSLLVLAMTAGAAHAGGGAVGRGGGAGFCLSKKPRGPPHWLHSRAAARPIRHLDDDD